MRKPRKRRKVVSGESGKAAGLSFRSHFTEKEWAELQKLIQASADLLVAAALRKTLAELERRNRSDED